LIGDKAYDSDPFDEALAADGIEVIAPHRRNRTKAKPRMVVCYDATNVAGRLNAWLQNFRRVIVRYEYYPENYQGFLQLGCLVILLRQYL
jgi:transposase